MIHISNLSYRHQSDGPDLFHNLDLMIPSGDFVALMGASGVGKSTLLSVMAGLKTPTSGSVLLGSKDITTIIGDELSDFRAMNVSMIFQSFELLDHLTVYENIELSIEI